MARSPSLKQKAGPVHNIDRDGLPCRRGRLQRSWRAGRIGTRQKQRRQGRGGGWEGERRGWRASFCVCWLSVVELEVLVKLWEDELWYGTIY